MLGSRYRPFEPSLIMTGVSTLVRLALFASFCGLLVLVNTDVRLTGEEGHHLSLMYYSFSTAQSHEAHRLTTMVFFRRVYWLL